MAMRKAQKKEFFKKVGEYVSKKLTFLMDVEGWENQELSEKCGIPQNRLSELKNKKRAVTELWLKALIGGGIMTVGEIKSNINPTEGEAKLLDGMEFYENKPLLRAISSAIAKGVDPEDIIKTVGKMSEEIDKASE